MYFYGACDNNNEIIYLSFDKVYTQAVYFYDACDNNNEKIYISFDKVNE